MSSFYRELHFHLAESSPLSRTPSSLYRSQDNEDAQRCFQKLASNKLGYKVGFFDLGLAPRFQEQLTQRWGDDFGISHRHQNCSVYDSLTSIMQCGVG